jgi:hypothetical protein
MAEPSPSSDIHTRALGESVDRLITADLAFRGVIHLLYPPARERQGAPLALAAAELLRDRVGSGDIVLLATGWPDRPWVSERIFETDGPPGAAALGRCLNLSLGAVPVLAVEEGLVRQVEQVVRGAGLVALTPAEARKAAESEHAIHAGAVIPWPADLEAAREKAGETVESLQPTAIIAIEKGSMNAKGRIHTRKGRDVTGPIAKVDPLVEAAAEAGIATIGVGDGGNEVGMGNIRESIRENLAFGEVCSCPCKGGIAPLTEVDVLVATAVSNWGAYGIEACLAFLTETPEAMHDGTLETLALQAAAGAGLMDGITGHVEPSADGLRAEVHAGMVNLLRSLVLNARTNVW